MVDYNPKPFGLNAEQKYLLHLQNIIHVHDIYKLVEASTKYIDLFARHKIEDVEGWGCRLMFTRPKKGINHKIDLNIYNDAHGFKRTVDMAYIDIPCTIDKVYYDNVHRTRWVDALGSDEKVSEIETQLKDNISTEITEDINNVIEDAFSDEANYRKGDGDAWKKVSDVVNGKMPPSGNYYLITAAEANDMNIILNFCFNLSSKFRSRNRIFQKGYYFDNEKARTAAEAWEQLETNTPSLKRIGIVCDSQVVNRMSTGKLADAFNTKYIDLKERFAYVEETNFKNVLKDGKKHEEAKINGGTEDFGTVYEDRKLLVWMGDVRVPVLKIREPKEGLRYKEETENGLRWFFLDSRVYSGLATCLNYVGLFSQTKDGAIA